MKKMIAVVIMTLLGVFGYGATDTFAATARDCVSIMTIVGNYEKSIFEEKDSYDHYIKLNESFEPNKYHYTADVDFYVNKVKVQMYLEYADGSGNMKEKEFELAEGDNEIEVSEVGKTYYIKINRKVNPNPNQKNTIKYMRLTDAYFKDIAISPALSTEITDYTATVESDVTYICVSAWDKYQHSFVKQCNLKKGENIIQIAIPLEAGGEQKYTLRITRKKSSDNKIGKMIVNESNNKKVNLGQNEIICDKKSNKYSLNVPYHTTQVSVDVYIDADATVSGYEFYNLKVGQNKINLKVTSEAGDVAQYVLMVNRLKPSAELSEIIINSAECGVDNQVLDFNVEYSTKTAEIKAVPKDRTAVIKGTGTHNLRVGVNNFTITVKSVDGKVKKYPIKIVRDQEKKVKVYIVVE